MKFYTAIFIISLFIFNCNICYSENIDELRAKANIANKNKDYTTALPLFEQLCSKYDNYKACYNIGTYYESGLGVQKNIDTAYNIYLSLIDKTEGELQDRCKLAIGRLIEYYYATNNDLLNNAMSIYNELQNSNYDEIKNYSIKGLNRIPIYNFFDELYSIIVKSDSEQINGNQFESSLLRLDRDILPMPLKSYFNDYMTDMVEVKKWDDTRIEKGLSLIGKSILKPLTGDFSIFFDAGKAFIDINSTDKLYKRALDNYSKFLNELLKVGISSTWLNAKLNQK